MINLAQQGSSRGYSTEPKSGTSGEYWQALDGLWTDKDGPIGRVSHGYLTLDFDDSVSVKLHFDHHSADGFVSFTLHNDVWHGKVRVRDSLQTICWNNGEVWTLCLDSSKDLDCAVQTEESSQPVGFSQVLKEVQNPWPKTGSHTQGLPPLLQNLIVNTKEEELTSCGTAMVLRCPRWERDEGQSYRALYEKQTSLFSQTFSNGIVQDDGSSAGTVYRSQSHSPSGSYSSDGARSTRHQAPPPDELPETFLAHIVCRRHKKQLTSSALQFQHNVGELPADKPLLLYPPGL